jgi:hypothetical protein
MALPLLFCAQWVKYLPMCQQCWVYGSCHSL